MTHGSKIVDFVGFDLRNDGNEACGVAQIAVMQEKFHSSLMAVSIDVIDTTSIEARGTTNNSMNLPKRAIGEVCVWN